MAADRDYSELLRILNESGAEYLVVGGYAVMHYTEPRYTKDLDIWVGNSKRNSRAVYRALLEFGAPLEADEVTPNTFAEAQVIYQIGVAPIRIDISTSIEGVRFETAWKNKIPTTLFGVPVHVISLPDLILNKESTGRKRDLRDAKQLRKQKAGGGRA